jgi:hypothetical protein
MDDFIVLPINSQVRTAALQALNELQELISSGSDIFSLAS